MEIAHSNEKTNGREYALIREWRAKRNVLGFYDGRPIKILPPLPNGEGCEQPEDYLTIGMVYFLAICSAKSFSRPEGGVYRSISHLTRITPTVSRTQRCLSRTRKVAKFGQGFPKTIAP